MNNNLLDRHHPLTAAVFIVAAVFVLLLGLYGLTVWSSDGEVMGRVDVAGVQLGGLTEAEARAAILELEEIHQARTLEFNVAGTPVQVLGAETGLQFETDRMVQQAMAMGREGNAAYRFLWWFTHIFSTEQITLSGGPERRALSGIFDEWDTEVVGQPTNHGGIRVDGNQLVPIYPNPGTGLDRGPATAIVERSLLAAQPVPTDLPTTTIIPRLTDADIDSALEEAKRLVGEPISLQYDGRSVVFTSNQLVNAYVATTITSGTPQIVHSFDPEVIDGYLQPIRSQYEAEPVDAVFEITGDEIAIIPGSRGTRIDENETAQKLLQAARSTSRIALLPVVQDADPAETTQMLEDMGIVHLVSSFTTYYEPGLPRVRNIQRMADFIKGARVAPGDTFSINAYVGPRTESKGYEPAPTLVGGQLVDTPGGGVSQFATTMYGAVFFGGYEDVDHRPHSVWFSRYPEGIEATINWTLPEFIFRNDTDKWIMIDTQHTDRSITVRIFGDNDGRTVWGHQSNARTIVEIVEEGGPDARHVEWSRSERYNETPEPTPEYRTDSSYSVDQRSEIQSGRPGWSIDVERRILIGGNTVYREQTWPVVYRPQRAIYIVHPCMAPDGPACPTTTTVTTTTIPSEDD